MTAKRGARLAIGAAVRHRYDGVRGVVRGLERGVGMYRVAFADGEDLVPAEDLRLVRSKGGKNRPLAPTVAGLATVVAKARQLAIVREVPA